MAYKNGYRPATISLTHTERDTLKSLAAMMGFLVGKPITYGQAIAEADRIVRDVFNDPETRDRFAPAPKPDHIVIRESLSA